MMGIKYVLPEASRRVKLLLDEKGDPAYPSATSPECFKPIQATGRRAYK
jgi:hypothetical protein